MDQDIRAGRIVGESFKQIFRNALTVFPIALLCCLPMVVALDKVEKMERERRKDFLQRDSPARREMDPAALAGLLSFYVAYPLACGAIAFAVHQSMRGRRASFFESFGAGLKRVFALFGVFLCSILFMMIGFVPAMMFLAFGFGVLPWVVLVLGAALLFILGIGAFMMVYVAIPVLVVERKGVFASMRRSRELTAGHRWQLFVAMFGVVVLGYVFGLVAAFAAGTWQVKVASNFEKISDTSTTALVLTTAVMSFLTAWTAAAAAVAYSHLVGVKDAVDVQDVAEVFD